MTLAAHRQTLFGVIALAIVGGGCELNPRPESDAVTEHDRKAAIQRASVWSPTEIRSVDFRTGPELEGAFAPNQWVTCVYKEVEMHGRSPKFTCETSPGQEIKVKYAEISCVAGP